MHLFFIFLVYSSIKLTKQRQRNRYNNVNLLNHIPLNKNPTFIYSNTNFQEIIITPNNIVICAIKVALKDIILINDDVLFKKVLYFRP